MAKSKRPIGVIAGTGVIGHFRVGSPKVVLTPFGKAVVYRAEENEAIVLPRHGVEHGVPPHKVNYRANIAALSILGVKEVIATSAVGSMNKDFRVGEIGLVGQFLDFTKGREQTFFDGEARHTDMTDPYSEELNRRLEESAKKLGIRVVKGLVYVCAEGPRFETAAEIRMFRSLGGDIVGMTGVPEVVLAREKGIEYSSIVIATNWAAGMQEKVSHEEVLKVMKRSGKRAKELIEATIKARK